MRDSIDILTFTILFIATLGCTMKKNLEEPTYIITESAKYDSLDPLDGDKTKNLPVQRMVYSTIFEVSPEDDYDSFLLDKFSFDKKRKELTLVIKSDLKFSDGTVITTKDIVFAILRMLKSRPNYPVIDKISGAREWSGRFDSLPKGISYDDKKILIRFDSMNFNPLSRFCMEIFSIIPSRCLDIGSGEINCKRIPSSGPYQISSESDTTVTFQKNKYFKASRFRDLPERIKFKYIGIKEVESIKFQLGVNEVLAGHETQLSKDKMDSLKKLFNFTMKPKVRFRALEIHPKNGFKNRSCRQAFAKLFRKFSKTSGVETENSIFTKIMKGYQFFDEHKGIECEKKPTVRWGYVKELSNSEFVEIMMGLLDSDQGVFKIEKPILFENYQQMDEALKSGVINISTSGSGFWAADPAGDIRMFLTEGMHKPLNFITSDPELQKLLTELENDQSPENFIKVNRYLYEDAKFNVYRHAARFYMTNKNVSLKNLPLGITSPAPYTVLEKLIESN